MYQVARNIESNLDIKFLENVFIQMSFDFHTNVIKISDIGIEGNFHTFGCACKTLKRKKMNN